MTHAVSFRQHVLKIKTKEQLTLKETSERFRIGIASVSRWMKHLAPKTTRNKPAIKIDREALKRDLERYPDAYQYERAKRFGVTSQGIWHALKRLGVTYKKNSTASQGRSRKAYYILPKG
jgi:transposase